MNEQASSLDQNIACRLKTLIRALTQNDLIDRYEAYKSLYELGPAVIPQLREAIFKSKWSSVKYANEIRYVAGLVNLVHDLDETESEKIRVQLKRDGCNPALALILDSVGSFKLIDYTQYDVCGVRVFEHERLVTKQNVKRRLERWLGSVPSEDLHQIDRIYVLRQEDLKSLGSYAPILCCINLAWDNPSPHWSPMSWVNNLRIENTLYHEIGHHVHRHTFGQDPEQEDAADKYASRIMAQRSDHWFFKVIRPFRRARSKNEE